MTGGRQTQSGSLQRSRSLRVRMLDYPAMKIERRPFSTENGRRTGFGLRSMVVGEMHHVVPRTRRSFPSGSAFHGSALGGVGASPCAVWISERRTVVRFWFRLPIPELPGMRGLDLRPRAKLPQESLLRGSLPDQCRQGLVLQSTLNVDPCKRIYETIRRAASRLNQPAWFLDARNLGGGDRLPAH